MPKTEEIIHRIFYGVMSAVAIYCANQIGNMQHSISELNVKMSVYIEKSESISKMAVDHEQRIRTLEGLK